MADDAGTRQDAAASERHRQDERTGRGLALLIWAVIVLGVAGTLYATQRWWLPPLASEAASGIDRLFYVMMIIIAVVFVLVHALLAVFLTRFSRRDRQRAVYWHHNRRLEMIWTLVPAAILIVLTVMGGMIWAAQSAPLPPDSDDPVVVEVWALQFGWLFHYPGPDGRLGETAVAHMGDGNPVGIDPDDAAGADDVVTRGEMALPAGRTVQVRIRSKDVIHSFFLPNFRVKQDAVPGRTTTAWFETSKRGAYEIACAELCGTGHFAMRATLEVMEPDAFDGWLQTKAAGADDAASE